MNKPLFIDLLRHGETEDTPGYTGQLDIALTEPGWQQMTAAVENRRYQSIVSSPLIRCSSFADWFRQQHNIPMNLDSRLQEMHFGEWQGKDSDTLLQLDQAAITAFWSDPVNHTPPGGESLAEFNLRVNAVRKALENSSPGQHILVVCHGGVIRLLLCQWLGIPLAHLMRLSIPHASLNRVRIDRTEDATYPQLLFLNGAPYE